MNLPALPVRLVLMSRMTAPSQMSPSHRLAYWLQGLVSARIHIGRLKRVHGCPGALLDVTITPTVMQWLTDRLLEAGSPIIHKN